jgi:hypothetical protein
MNTFTFHIKEALVILTNGTDKIFLKTDFPCPFVKEFMPAQYPLTIQFDATYDTGVEYVKKNFGIDPEVIVSTVPFCYAAVKTFIRKSSM